MIKAVIFDFDGLIVDTETPLYQAYYQVFQEHGVELPVDVWSSFLGTGLDPYDYLRERLKAPVHLPPIEAKVQEHHDMLMQKQQLRPGVEAYLRTAKRLRLKIGLASSAQRIWVEGYVRKFHLFHYFDCILTGNNMTKAKPAPDVYQLTLRHLGVSPAQAIAFEDSLHGMNAAKSAGLRCVIVPNPVTQHLSFEGCDLRIDSMADVPLEEIIDRLEKQAHR
jgi:putative hydrolase of the HAD superfamily